MDFLLLQPLHPRSVPASCYAIPLRVPVKLMGGLEAPGWTLSPDFEFLSDPHSNAQPPSMTKNCPV